jgi:hypothetical protein
VLGKHSFDPLGGHYVREWQTGLRKKGVGDPLKITTALLGTIGYIAHRKTLLGGSRPAKEGTKLIAKGGYRHKTTCDGPENNKIPVTAYRAMRAQKTIRLTVPFVAVTFSSPPFLLSIKDSRPL